MHEPRARDEQHRKHYACPNARALGSMNRNAVDRWPLIAAQRGNQRSLLLAAVAIFNVKFSHQLRVNNLVSKLYIPLF